VQEEPVNALHAQTRVGQSLLDHGGHLGREGGREGGREAREVRRGIVGGFPAKAVEESGAAWRE
jgi:hypothetical protein